MSSFYKLYACRYEGDGTLAFLSNALADMKNLSCIFYHDLQKQDKNVRRDLLDSHIRAERFRVYEEGSESLYINIFHLGMEEVLLLVSACEEGMRSENEKVLDRLFGGRVHQAGFLHGNPKYTKEQSLKYWEDFFAERRLSLPVQKKELGAKQYAERFPLPDTLKSKIKSYETDGRKSIKASLYAAIGNRLAEIMEADRVLLADVHDGGSLQNVPLIYDRSMSAKEGYESIKRQLINAEYNDACTDAELIDVCRLQMATTPLVTVSCQYDKKYSFFTENMKPGVVYHFCPIHFFESAFNALINFSGGDMSIVYTFDEKLSEQMDVELLHERLCAHLLGFLCSLDGDERSAEVVGADKSDSDKEVAHSNKDKNNQRREQVLLSFLKQLSLFADYSNEDLSRILPLCDVKVCPAQVSFLRLGDVIDRTYFVVMGEAELIRKREDGEYVLDAHMGKGECFGIHSVDGAYETKTIFRTAAINTIVLSIKSADLLKEAEKNPGLYPRILHLMRIVIDRLMDSKVYEQKEN